MSGATTVTLPQDTVDKAIRETVAAHIVGALDGLKRDELVRLVVEAALTEKVDQGYSRGETKFGKALRDAIREACNADIKKWLEERKGEITKLIRASLKARKPKLEQTITDAVVKGLESGVAVTVSLTLSEERY